MRFLEQQDAFTQAPFPSRRKGYSQPIHNDTLFTLFPRSISVISNDFLRTSEQDCFFSEDAFSNASG